MKISSMHRIYVDAPLSQGNIVTLEGEQSHYLTNVLRLKIESKIRIFNETSGEYIASLSNIGKKSCDLEICDLYRGLEKIQKLSLIQSIIKNDRMAQILDMSTQLGVSDIFPVISDRSQIRTINYDRFRKIIIESSEQSERMDVPVLHEVSMLDKLLGDGKFDRIIFANENEENSRLLTESDLEKCDNLAILVGPEGGFTDREMSMILSHAAARSISLGSHVLRAETAVAAICAQVQLLRR